MQGSTDGEGRSEENDRPILQRVKTFGCIAFVGLPLAVVIACGGACAAIGEPRGERDIGLYLMTFLGIGFAAVVAAVGLAAWYSANRD